MTYEVITVVGRAQSGKSTFCNIFKRKNPHTIEVSLADPAKNILQAIGENPENKTPTNRAFLCEVKNLTDKYYGLSFKNLNKRISQYCDEMIRYGLDNTHFYVLVHSRELNDIKRLKETYNATTVKIDDCGARSIKPEDASNQADIEVDNVIPDYTIYNIGTLDDFEHEINKFLEEYM